MSEIRVEWHAGCRADQRPFRFVPCGRKFLVHELDGRWYSPEASYFRVRADDGSYYVLRHDGPRDSRTLDGVRGRREEHMKSSPEDLRQHQRILVPKERSIRAAASGSVRPLAGVVTVIGLGGMFLRTKDLQPPGAKLDLVLTDALVTFEVRCIVRHAAKNGLGIEFSEISPENEQKLQTLLLELKT